MNPNLLLGVLAVVSIIAFYFVFPPVTEQFHSKSCHNNSGTLPQDSDESSHNNKGTLPQDILDAISKCLKDSPKELASVMILLRNNKDTTEYFQILRSVMTNDEAFRRILLSLAEDAKPHQVNPEFQRVMANISNNYQESSTKKKEYGQCVDDHDALPKRANEIGAVTIFNFVQTLSSIPPSDQAEMVQITTDTAEAVWGSSMAQVVHRSGEWALILAKFKQKKLFALALLVCHLVYEAYQSLRQWWNSEIFGARAVENIFHNIVGVAAGVGGGFAGAAIGGAIVPGIGTVVGGVLGGVASNAAASAIFEWITQSIFNLPKGEALEIASRSIGGASNDEIYAILEKLVLKYHQVVAVLK